MKNKEVINTLTNLCYSMRNFKKLIAKYKVPDNFEGECIPITNMIIKYIENRNIFPGCKVYEIHGEQSHHPRILTRYWYYQHSWGCLKYNGKKYYFCATASQFKDFYDDIPDVYVSTKPPKWYLSDRKNIMWRFPLKKLVHTKRPPEGCSEEIRVKYRKRSNMYNRFHQKIEDVLVYGIWGSISNTIHNLFYYKERKTKMIDIPFETQTTPMFEIIDNGATKIAARSYVDKYIYKFFFFNQDEEYDAEKEGYQKIIEASSDELPLRKLFIETIYQEFDEDISFVDGLFDQANKDYKKIYEGMFTYKDGRYSATRKLAIQPYLDTEDCNPPTYYDNSNNNVIELHNTRFHFFQQKHIDILLKRFTIEQLVNMSKFMEENHISDIDGNYGINPKDGNLYIYDFIHMRF